MARVSCRELMDRWLNAERRVDDVPSPSTFAERRLYESWRASRQRKADALNKRLEAQCGSALAQQIAQKQTGRAFENLSSRQRREINAQAEDEAREYAYAHRYED